MAERQGNMLDQDPSSSNNNQEQNTYSGPDIDLLKSIDSTLKEILSRNKGMSQSAARSSMPGDRGEANKWEPNRSRQNAANTKSGSSMSSSLNFKSVTDGFLDGLEDTLLESVLGPDFKNKIHNTISGFADAMGVGVGDIPKKFGQAVGKKILNTDIGKQLSSRLSSMTDGAMSRAKDAFMRGVGKYQESSDSNTDFTSIFENIFSNSNANQAADAARSAANSGAAEAFAGAESEVAGEVAGLAGTSGEAAALAESSELAGAALSGLGEAAIGLAHYALAAVGALYIFDKALETLGPAIEGVKKKLFESAGKAANRYEESRKKNLEEAKKRFSEDVDSMIRAPFEILEEAAKNLYDAWDSNVRKINATQGYTKDDLYNLFNQYASRLKSEGLSDVVSTSDIISSLSKVLDSGLSGEVAVEFAYLASKLNAAIPTQDFFNYAESYASIAANAIKDGKSQSQAISEANSQIESFASNISYASRQLSGGFSTGLANASELFSNAVKIAQAAKTNNSTEIGGVLSAASALVGSIAPDLTNDIVSAIVSAATGGNDSTWVALRSLSGINASNTEWLQQFAVNPQQVLTNMFRGLASMQNMSNANYMEVAEGVSSVFGMSMDAFTRVDFNYLADAISQMDMNNSSLDDNIKLLASGQTTTNAEILRMRQINEYMVNEGLAYVMDNEVARAIQQHMWDEQLAREIQESTYAVELKGAALDFLEGIKQTVDNIVNFLNPFSWFKKAVNLAATNAEKGALGADIKQLLELGKVGNGNARDLYNLTTTNQNLKLTSSIIDMMGGVSLYKQIDSNLQSFNHLLNPSGLMDGVSALKSALSSSLQNAVMSNASKRVNSKYTWAVVGKSISDAFIKSSTGSQLSAAQLKSATVSTAAAVQSRGQSNFQKYLDSMSSYIEENRKANKEYSYEGWKATATKYGIKDFNSAIEQYGLSENELQSKFTENEASEASKYEHERELAEDEFWAQATAFAKNEQQPWLDWETLVTDNQKLEIDNQLVLIQTLTTTNAKLDAILSPKNGLVGFYNQWVRYYVEHEAYSEATHNAYLALNSVKGAKESGTEDAVNALANKLVENAVDLKDPTVQTNALLAQILLVIQAIMQHMNETGQLSIPDALSALSLGALDTGNKVGNKGKKKS